MKYKIILGGRGADIYIHQLNENQRTLLSEGKADNPVLSIEYEQVCEILKLDNVDDSDVIFTGIYDNTENIVVEVYDENDNVVFNSLNVDGGWYFDLDMMDEHDNYDSIYEEGNYLFVESYCKGPFFEFYLECEEFNPSLLTPEKLEINERWDLITGLYYNGEKIEDKEYGDYWGKGYYYYLS